MQNEGNQKIGVREKFSYGLGDVACNVVFALTMSMSTYFYTNVIGMSAALVGVILMVSRLFDGVSDAIMGVLVDRTHSKHGKARVWILRMILPYGISAVLMFMVPSNASVAFQAIYVFLTYNLAVTVVYTALNLPYGTMATLMTTDQGDRSILNIYRMSMSPIGALIVTALTMPLINRLGGDQRAWIIVTVAYAILAMVMLLACFLGCKERVGTDVDAPKETVPLRVGVKCMLHNKYWRLVAIMFLAWAVYFTLNSTMLTYYAQYELGNNELMGVISVAEKVPSILIAIAIVPFIRRLGKRNLSLIGSVIMLVGATVILLQPRELSFVLAGSVLKGIGGGIVGALIYSLLADTIEYGHWLTGVRTEGLLYSASSVGYKVGGGMTNAVIGGVMEFAGFQGMAQNITQSAHNAISFMYLIIPFAAWGLMAVLLWFYKLDREYPKMVEELQRGQYHEDARINMLEDGRSAE